MITYKDISTRYTMSGNIEASAVVCGYTMKHQYNGFTKKEALKLFHEQANKAEKFGSRWIMNYIFRGY